MADSVWLRRISRAVPAEIIPAMLAAEISGVAKVSSRSREQRVLIMVIVMVICFLLCWLPYGIMALIATFGKPGLITPSASIIPSVLAKSSTVYNPIIYIFLNKQFYRCFIALLHCNRTPQPSSYKFSSKTTKICMATRKLPENVTCNAPSSKLPSSEMEKTPIINEDTQPTNYCQEDAERWHLNPNPSLTLVAYYTP